MKKTRFVAIVLLLAAIMSSFPREAAAANRPKWLKITWTWSLEKRGTKDAYINVKVTHTNNGDQAVTAIYDKTVTISGEYSHGMELGGPFKRTFASKKRNMVDLWPGDSYTLQFHFTVAGLNVLTVETPSEAIQSGFRNMKLGYDCRVRTK